MPPDAWTVFVSDRAQAILAGGLGGVVRWLTLREDWRSGLVSVTVGAILAAYLGPLAAPAIKALLGPVAPDPAASSAALSGLVVGLGGITLSGLILDVWTARRRAVRREEDPPP